MFNIIKSNRMENLMDALVSVLGQVPDNPMMPEWIGIQSKGMKQWISIEMARRLDVCANLHFVFPRQMVDTILCGARPMEPVHQSLNEDVLFWSVMRLINENRASNALALLRPYIRNDDTGKKLYQLSGKMAKVFDDYQVYRPDMLMDWQAQAHPEPLKDPVAVWQADLWRKLVSRAPKDHLAYKSRMFLEKETPGVRLDHLPSRMSLFGISTLPRLFLQVFEKISASMDINLFLLAPSDQFFFDIKSARQISRIAVNQDSGTDLGQLYYETTNPLLSSFGTSGKDFQSGLEEFDYHEPFEDLFEDPAARDQTLLAMLQSDILNLVHRKQGQENLPIAVAGSDSSVGIHACHSPMREAQVLKDLLLDAFEKDPDLAPDDVIVMMPDIEAYAPFIESVFTLESPLPFSISDRRKRSESEPLDAFLKILALKNSRLEQTRVLDLLLSESIAKKFKITDDEITRIEKMVQDAHILWAKDAAHRKDFNLPPFEENTWQFGLQRLFMGMAMPENHEGLVQNILACPSFEGLDLEVLGKLAGFCHAVFACLETLDGHKTVDAWCAALKLIADRLLDRNFENEPDMGFLIQTIDQTRDNARKAGFDQQVLVDLIVSAVEQKLDQTMAQGNFLAGRITFCNIMPMRSIPFKIVVLMGMDEKAFPRTSFTPGFNLIKKYPRPGDKQDRDEDRYLFLETLLSARSRFICTYTGMSIQDNSPIPCSSVVSELLDTIHQGAIFQQGRDCQFFHPLHPFHTAYFQPDGFLPSFSRDNCHIAQALSNGRPRPRMFVEMPLPTVPRDPVSAITIEELVRFFKNPVERFMQDTCHIHIPAEQDQARTREVFTVSGLDQYSLGSFLVERPSGRGGQPDFYPVLKAMGSLPLGEKGRLEYDRIKTSAGPVIAVAETLAQQASLPAVSSALTIDGLRVSGTFFDLRKKGAYAISYGKLNSARLLSAWIRHLFLNLCAPCEYPKKTLVVGRDPRGKTPVLTYCFPVLEQEALAYFKALIQVYAKARQQPFYFFCETAWQFVQALSKENYVLTPGTILSAMNRAKASWYGGHHQTGEKENRHVKRCVEQNDPFESVDALMACGFVDNAILVYKPLLENLILE